MSRCDSRNAEWKKFCNRTQRRKNKQVQMMSDEDEIELITDTRKTDFGDVWNGPYDDAHEKRNRDNGRGHDKKSWND